MVKIRRIIIALFFLVWAVLMVFICFAALRGALYGLWDIPSKLNWKEKTTPLDQNVINDICLKFALPSRDPRCQPGAVVYAPDFFGVIRETFAPRGGPWATYEQVQAKLEKYQISYEPPVTTGDGFTYFTAQYDLRGDQVYRIGMFFYADGRLWRFIADIGN